MYKTRKELKQEAKEALRGNWGWAIGVTILPILLASIVFYLINNVFLESLVYESSYQYYTDTTVYYSVRLTAFGTILSIFYSVIFACLSFGIDGSLLDFLKKGEKRPILDAGLYSFKEGRFGKVFLTNLVMGIFMYLWGLLLVIPGLIKGYSYAMANYILKERLEAGHAVTATSSITESRRLMDGHKMDLFVLMLSFFGWFLLVIPTFGIGMIWLAPYMRLTIAAFYKDLVKNSGETIVNDGDADSSADKTANTAIIS